MKLNEAALEAAWVHRWGVHEPQESVAAIVSAYLDHMRDQSNTHLDLSTGEGVVAEQVGVMWRNSSRPPESDFELLTMEDRYHDCEGDAPVYTLTEPTKEGS